MLVILPVKELNLHILIFSIQEINSYILRASGPHERLGDPERDLETPGHDLDPRKGLEIPPKKDRNPRNLLRGIVETTYGTPEKGSRTP